MANKPNDHIDDGYNYLNFYERPLVPLSPAHVPTHTRISEHIYDVPSHSAKTVCFALPPLPLLESLPMAPQTLLDKPSYYNLRMLEKNVYNRYQRICIQAPYRLFFTS